MSQEAEQAVLGGLMLDNSKLDIIDLEPDHFTSLAHKKIFKSILDLRSQDLAFDAITIAEDLDSKNDLGAVGTPYLMELSNNTINSRNVPSYAKIVKRDYKNNTLKGIGLNIQMLAEDGSDCDKNIEAALKLFDSFNVEGEKDLKPIGEHVAAYVEDLEARMSQEGVDGLETGFRDLDKRLQGLKAGELIIIAGRPASGKSALALNIAHHIAKTDPVMFFSMEMPSKQLVQRSVASLGNVDLNWLKFGLKEDDSGWGAATHGATQLAESQLILDDNGLQTIQSIKVKCKKQGKLGAVFVDYLQLIRGKGENRTQEIGLISRSLKELSKELQCPVIALSQLNRGLESRKDKRPLMSDLRESGDIEQDADIILMLYRDEYYYPEFPPNQGFAEINTAKFRDGEVGKDYLATELAKSQFKDIMSFTYQPFEEKNKKGGGFSG